MAYPKKANLAVVFGVSKAPKERPAKMEDEYEDETEEKEGKGLQELLTDYDMCKDTGSRARALAEFIRAVVE